LLKAGGGGSVPEHDHVQFAHNMCELLESPAMNITLSVDERIAEQARKAAQAMGKSLNQAVRDYLEQLAGGSQLAVDLAAFEQSALATPGRLQGWRFDREEANRRAQPD
jgi:antitoxin component of RelBE/YafQ-DinJ toxin-antitoxin module